MNISDQDSLRLNVMLRQKPTAVRIDDSKMIVYALTKKGEAKIQLNPTCKEEKYLRLVRELLSTHVMGSPGGYPVYIRRWTRLGQERDHDSLKTLLLLGEPEAVTAVVNTPNITSELAELAWWSLPSSEIARELLNSPAVVSAEIGRELAEYLIEFMPFEENHQYAIDSIRLALQPGLIDTAKVNDLWKKAKRRQSYYIGFLHTLPDALPAAAVPHPQLDEHQAALTEINSPTAKLLLRTLSAPGQAFVNTANQVFEKLPNQDAAVELMEAIGNYFAAVQPDQRQYRSIEEIQARGKTELENAEEILHIKQTIPALAEKLQTMLALSMLSEYLVAPIFGHTDAIGSVMRKRLQPVTVPVRKYLADLQS